MRDYLRAVLMLGLVIGAESDLAAGQVDGGSAPLGSARTSHGEPFADRPELLRRVASYEAALRQAEVVHSPVETVVNLYLHLGATYSDLAMYPRSEQAMQRAIELLRSGPQDELAAAISDLAFLHIVTGELRVSEKEGLEALRIRERVGEPTPIANSWTQMAALYLERHEYKKAVEFGQKAVDVFDRASDAESVDPIAVRFTMARALCNSRECAKAIPLLKQSITLAEETYGKDGLLVGLGSYLLGYAYWQTGDMAGAAEWMERGTTRMKVELGWGHPLYVDALGKYALFLRGRGRTEEAALLEREVRQAKAVVDVGSLAARPAAKETAGLH
jgi:tetratricopeptide (TPR) repeat protein